MPQPVTTDELAGMVKGGFDGMESRFDQVDTRFGQVDARIDRVEQHLEHMDARLERIERVILADYGRRIERLENAVALPKA